MPPLSHPKTLIFFRLLKKEEEEESAMVDEQSHGPLWVEKNTNNIAKKRPSDDFGSRNPRHFQEIFYSQNVYPLSQHASGVYPFLRPLDPRPCQR